MIIRKLIDALSQHSDGNNQLEVVTWGLPNLIDDGDGHMDDMGTDYIRHIDHISRVGDKIVISFKDEEETL